VTGPRHKNLESDRIWCSGILVSNYADSAHHWAATRTLSEWMIEHEVPGLSGIDTRALTKMIREDPSLLARIEAPGGVGAHGVGDALFDRD
jgi:carbamoylphosphate synthase small subunit